MTISEWLDEKEAEGVDVSQIALPDDLSFDEDPEETIFFEEIKPCGFLREITPFLPSSVLDTGILVGDKIKMPVFILQEWSGDYLRKIKPSLSKQRNTI